MNLRRTLLIAACVSLAACTDDDTVFVDDPANGPDFGATATLVDIDTSTGTDDIVALPATVDARITAVFDRYTQLTTGSGRRIHFLSQTGVSDAALFRIRGMVRQHTFDVAGSSLGADKTAVYDAISSTNSVLALYADSMSFDEMDADVMAFLDLFGDTVQTLDVSTTVQEGSADYVLTSPAIDSALDATARFVHRYGIEVVSPTFRDDLAAALDNAVMNDLFRPDAGLDAALVDDAYLGLALSVYYGVWGHDPNGDGTAGAAGEYDFSDRAAMQAGDPLMFAVIESFFAETHRYPAFLDETFTGTFEMEFDPFLPYTNRSQYLERAGLRGTAVARINGNDLDNIFLGNDEATDFEGGGGNDSIEGGLGADRAFFSGLSTEYVIMAVDGEVTRVEDSINNRDGINDLRGIDQAVFTDTTLNL